MSTLPIILPTITVELEGGPKQGQRMTVIYNCDKIVDWMDGTVYRKTTKTYKGRAVFVYDPFAEIAPEIRK